MALLTAILLAHPRQWLVPRPFHLTPRCNTHPSHPNDTSNDPIRNLPPFSIPREPKAQTTIDDTERQNNATVPHVDISPEGATGVPDVGEVVDMA